MITLGRTTLTRNGRIVVATFDDGTSCEAHPHDEAACGVLHPFDAATCNAEAYARVAIDHGCFEFVAFDDSPWADVDAYVWEHELAHVLVALRRPDTIIRAGFWFPPGVSLTLWALAHGWPSTGAMFEAEEKAASELQKAWHRC